MLCKGQLPDALPPTSDAERFHIKRAHNQSMIWMQDNVTIQQLPLVTDMGWAIVNDELAPQFMSLPPNPKACGEIVSCSCLTGYLSKRCSCKTINLSCTEAYVCVPLQCRNFMEFETIKSRCIFNILFMNFCLLGSFGRCCTI